MSVSTDAETRERGDTGTVPAREGSLRVLLLNQTFYPDVAATAQMAHDLARHLVAHGHQVVVVTSRSLYGQKGAVLPKRETVEGIEVHRVGFSLFGRSSIVFRLIDFALFYVLATLRVLLIRRCDVVIPFTTPPMIALVGWLLRVLRGTRYVYWVMDLYPDVAVACGVLKPRGLVTWLCERVSRFCLCHADRVVVLGRCMKQRLLGKGIADGQVAVINVWSDSEELTPIEREANPYRREWQLGDAFVVMYSGNLGIAHDADTLCQTMLRLRGRGDIRFVFVGGGKRMADVERFAREHDLPNVQFHPYQPRERLHASLSLADVHLLSLADPIAGIIVPSKVYGILAIGRPAIYIGPANSEAAMVISENACGQIVPCGDVDRLVQSIEQLAGDRSLCATLGRRARQAHREKYDRHYACDAWENLLREVGR